MSNVTQTKTRSHKILDDHWSVRRGYEGPVYHPYPGTVLIDVVTPFGIVVVDTDADGTRLDFAHAGRMYRRQIVPSLSRRGAVRKACAFAREIGGTKP